MPEFSHSNRISFEGQDPASVCILPKGHALAAAAAMASILERLAAYHRELEGLGMSRSDLVESSAEILHRTVAGE